MPALQKPPHDFLIRSLTAASLSPLESKVKTILIFVVIVSFFSFSVTTLACSSKLFRLILPRLWKLSMLICVTIACSHSFYSIPLYIFTTVFEFTLLTWTIELFGAISNGTLMTAGMFVHTFWKEYTKE